MNLKKAKEHPVLSIKVKIWCLFEQMLTNESACIKEIDVIQSENAYSKFTLIRLNAIMKIMRVRIDVEKFIAFTTTGVKGRGRHRDGTGIPPNFEILKTIRVRSCLTDAIYFNTKFF